MGFLATIGIRYLAMTLLLGGLAHDPLYAIRTPMSIMTGVLLLGSVYKK